MKKTLLLISFLMITFSAAWAVTGLNPYAHNLKAEQTNDNRTLRISYCLNAEAKSVTIEILSEDGRTVLLSQSGPTQETTYSTSNSSYTSPNTVDISIANLIGYIGKSLPWRITVVGDSPEVPTKVSQTYNFYCPQGVAVDNNPTSPNFGKIFVTETLHGASIVESKNYYSKMPYGKTEAGTIVAGVYVLSPDFRKITANSTPLTGGKDFSQVIKPFSGFDGGHQPYRICISEDSRIFVSSGDKRSDKVIVWEIDKNNLNSWTPLIQGSTWNDEWQVTRNSSFYAGLNCSMDVTGSGSNLKLLLFSTNKTSAKGMVSNGFRLDEYSIGTSTGVFTGTPREISALSGKYAVAYDNVNVIYDGKGGYWFGASRGENISKQLNLLHVNADENTTNNSYYKDTLYGGAGLKIHHSSLGEDWLIKGVKMVNNNGRFRIWKLKYSGQTPSRSTKYNVISGGMKRNHNAFAIDYAENLFVVGNNGEKCYAFALPYCGTKTTPAAQEITLQKPDNLKTYNINLAISNDSEGMGTVDGGGAHLEMDSITVSALPTDANRYEFEKWTENEVTVSTNANYTFQVTKERNLVAHFKIKKFKVEYFNLFQNQQDITDYHKTYNDPETEQIDYQRNTRLWRLFQVEYNAIYTPHDDRGDVAAYNIVCFNCHRSDGFPIVYSFL